MNGILNLMHECAHLHVFKDRSWSEALGKRVIAPLVFADFAAYRRRHWDHHRFLGHDGETKDAYLIDIRGGSFFKAFVRCVVMAEAARKFFKQTDRAPESQPASLGWLLDVLIVQAVFGASLILTARAFNSGESWATAIVFAAVAYTVVYLHGLMSLTVFMASLRAIAEHQQYDAASARAGYAALRNFTCTPLSRFLMGAYGFGEHFTHHRAPGIPYYRLHAATADMAREDPSLRPEKDYFTVLAEIFSSRVGADHSTSSSLRS